MEFLKELFVLLGRLCISAMFLWTAFEKIRNWNTTVSYMRTKNIPQLNIVLPVSLALKIIGGLSVLVGWHAHIGALLLLIVTVPSAVKLHAFWTLQGNERNMEKALFMKEIAVIGGLLLLLALGAGQFGIGR